MIRFYNDPKLVSILAKQLQKDDDYKASVTVKDNNIIDSEVIGVITFYQNADDAKSTTIPIRLVYDKFFYSTQTPEITKVMPLASCILTKTNDKFIVINEALRQYALGNDLDYDITSGILAHEVGHILAKHFENNANTTIFEDCKSDSTKPFNPKEVFPIIADSLIKNNVFGGEYEADCHAIELVGLSPILSYLTRLGYYTDNLGVRWEILNRIARHTKDSLEGKYTNTFDHKFSFYILSDFEVEEMHKEVSHA